MTDPPTDRPATNRLAGETSPYLLQHAHNPVAWYPWGPEALARARDLDRPILLSIGYAACHWCHVMERESFEDPATAALMNEHFVSIKVDREERPDLDGIYMDAVQAMNGHGGWPLTAFLTPEGEPFYAGTYYPAEPTHGLPSFRQVLTAIADAWRDRRGEIAAQAAQVVEHIARTSTSAATDRELGPELLEAATGALAASFDPRWGGFGGAPKFPQAPVLEFLLRRAARGDGSARDMLTTTLDRMADGGIYDQLGGGFARYATDAMWLVPHFEKMLPDNAQLLQVYVRAWLLTRRERYAQVARETAEYLLREMQHPEGGFWSSQDADAEGVEGAFAVWRWDELVTLVGEHVAACLGATPAGNWEGANVLWRPYAPQAYAAEAGIDPGELADEVEDARRALFEVREARTHPGTDDKVLTAWNALAIAALAQAGRSLGEPDYVDAALRAATFVTTHLRDPRGRLLRSWRGGVAGRPAFADDHALLAEACLALHETTFEDRWFAEARRLCDDLLRLFLDPGSGGFFQTGTDADTLVIRPKDVTDNAMPSGNSAAASVLQRMASLTGEAGYARAAAGALGVVADVVGRAPTGFGTALCALDLWLGPVREVAVVGEVEDPRTVALARAITTDRFVPNAVVAVGPPDPDAVSPIPLLHRRGLVEGAPAAYVCEGFVCAAPTSDATAMLGQLGLA